MIVVFASFAFIIFVALWRIGDKIGELAEAFRDRPLANPPKAQGPHIGSHR